MPTVFQIVQMRHNVRQGNEQSNSTGRSFAIASLLLFYRSVHAIGSTFHATGLACLPGGIPSS
jgi:hypothetical protein